MYIIEKGTSGMTRLFGTFLLLATFSIGCSQPTDIAIAFHESLAKKDGERVYELLSWKNKEILQNYAQAAYIASDGQVANDPTEMIVQGDPAFYSDLTRPGAGPALTAKYVSRSANSASVLVTIGTQNQKLNLVRENGSWRVHLPLLSLSSYQPYSSGELGN